MRSLRQFSFFFFHDNFYMHKKHKKNAKHQKIVWNFLFFYHDKTLHAEKVQKEYKVPKDSFKLFIFLVKKLSCLNDTGSTKLVKIHTAIQTKSSIVRLAKKLTYLNDIKTSFLEPFKLFIFYRKILHALKALKA